MSDQERSEAARAMGRARSPRKTEAARVNGEKGADVRWQQPGAREQQAQAMKKRWADPAARKRHADKIREAARRKKEAEQNEASDAAD